MEGQKEGMPRLLLLADDLTGALDCSVQFVGRATTVGVAVRPGVCVEANVVAVDTRTRDAPGAAVRAPLVEAWRQAGATRLYLKIDSALRGAVGLSIRSLLEAGAGEVAVVAPALPGHGRTTLQGRQHLPGFSKQREQIDIVGLLRGQGLSPAHVPIDTVRAGALALRAELEASGAMAVVVDAETDADLGVLARALVEWPGMIPVGSAGLAGALAREWFKRSLGRAPSWEPIHGAILFVCGSRHMATRAQIEHLRVNACADVVALHPGARLTERAAAPADQVERALRRGRDVVLTSAGHAATDQGEDPAIAAHLAEVAESLLPRGEFEAIVATGGYTAAQLCDRLRIDTLEVAGELSPGIVLSRPAHGRHRPRRLVTKAGSFGHVGTLAEIGTALRRGGVV